MKVYLLNVDYYYKYAENNEYDVGVYSTLDKAIEEGKYLLSNRCKDDGFVDYDFTVTETDPEYAEKFAKDITCIRLCFR